MILNLDNCLSFFFLLAIALSVFRFTMSDKPFNNILQSLNVLIPVNRRLYCSMYYLICHAIKYNLLSCTIKTLKCRVQFSRDSRIDDKLPNNCLNNIVMLTK
jgi:hypothetical protein